MRNGGGRSTTGRQAPGRPVDFGDRVSGREADENTGRLVRCGRFVSGVVVGVFPAMPKVAVVQTTTGERIVARVIG